MKTRIRLASLLFMLMLLQPCISIYAAPRATPRIYGRVVDFKTGKPIPNATIILAWCLESYKFFTDKNGFYNISGPFIIWGRSYYIYAFRGNFTQKNVDYVPTVKIIKMDSWEKKVDFALVPGALIELKGSWYLVQSPSPERKGTFTLKVLGEDGSRLNIVPGMVDEYGSSVHAWFLGLGSNLVIVPADTPVIVKTEVYIFLRSRKGMIRKDIILYNGSVAFNLPQGAKSSILISDYTLRNGLDTVRSKFNETISQINDAQSVGFVVFDEKRRIMNSYRRIMEADSLLAQAKNDDDYLKVWSILRSELKQMDLILMTIQYMYMASKTGAVYLSAIMAVFSAVLALFLFEKEKGKIISCIVIYIIYLVLLYFLYPGAHIIIEENSSLFIGSSVASIIIVLAFIFGIPRVWKERTIEGEVSWRSAISVIFSMGKRQIKRRKIRGFFTILSIAILILAFTSLTSFGRVFGIVSERINITPPSNGILVKRMVNKTLLFLPLRMDDPQVLSKIIEMKNIAIRIENLPSSRPIALIKNPRTGSTALIYGILGIDPVNETKYIPLDKIITEGDFLDENNKEEILISSKLASILDVKANETVTLHIQGVSGVSGNFTVKGIFNGDEYENLIDLDGQPYGPIRIFSNNTLRVCNSTEVIIMNWKTAEDLKNIAKIVGRQEMPQFATLSEIVFQIGNQADMKSIIKYLLYVFDYDVFVSSSRSLTHFYIDSYVEIKGATELLIPLVMAGLNTGMVMLNSVYERRKEIRILLMLGLNPTHIGLIFLAEAVILGMVGGSLGYLFGLGFYRIMVLLQQDLMVREKIEWYWSAIAFAIAIIASILSAVRPAYLAISTYTPSKIKRLKLPEREAKERREKIFKVYQARELSMPVKVKTNEIEFFVSYVLSSLNDLRIGYVERIENIEETPEIENIKKELVRSIKFDYYFQVAGGRRGTKNTLIMTKHPQEDYYRVKLICEPTSPGMPESVIERTVDLIFDMMMYWVKNKERIIGE